MRLFIAVEIPEENKNYIKSIQEEIKTESAKLSFVEEFHITLKFLGEVDENKVEKIKSSLENIEFEKFNSFINDKIGFFPSEKNPRVVWLDILPEEHFSELKSTIDVVLKGLFKPDGKFKAHLTLARIKFVKNKKEFNEKVKHLKNLSFEKKQFLTGGIKLVKSTLSRTGPEYEDVFVKNLKTL